jgi:hypothetical protein
MSTFAAIKARIADDLNRTDLTSQIEAQVLAAIYFYRAERLPFTETTSTLTGTASQGYLTAPTDLVVVDKLYITSGTSNSEMVRRDINDIVENRDTTSTGTPYAYAYHQNRIELDCLCSDAFSFPIYYIKALTALSGAGDTNGWTTDGEELIVNHAEKILYASVIKDETRAKVAQELERQALTTLRAMMNSRVATGYTKAYYL